MDEIRDEPYVEFRLKRIGLGGRIVVNVSEWVFSAENRKLIKGIRDLRTVHPTAHDVARYITGYSESDRAMRLRREFNVHLRKGDSYSPQEHHLIYQAVRDNNEMSMAA